jgi:adenylate kinase family enzyme
VRRIAVIGNGAGGKTTLARALSERLGVPHHEVDAAQFRSDWTRVPASAVAHELDAWLADDGWVIDGFGPLACVERRLDAADTVLWLDLPLRTHLLRALRRRGGPPLRVTLASIVRAHLRYRPAYAEALHRHEGKLVRLRSPHETERFLETRLCSEDARAQG